MRVAVI